MQITDFYAALVHMDDKIKAQGLDGYAQGHVNWFGDQLEITVVAREDADENGHWRSEKKFSGEPEHAKELIAEADLWIAGLPDQEQRAIELMVRKLHEMADKLPKGGSDVARAAWEEIGRMLLAKAERISKNGLSSPERISQLPRVS